MNIHEYERCSWPLALQTANYLALANKCAVVTLFYLMLITLDINVGCDSLEKLFTLFVSKWPLDRGVYVVVGDLMRLVSAWIWNISCCLLWLSTLFWQFLVGLVLRNAEFWDFVLLLGMEQLVENLLCCRSLLQLAFKVTFSNFLELHSWVDIAFW